MAGDGKDKCWIALSVIAILIAIAAIVLSVCTYKQYKKDKLNDGGESAIESLKAMIKKQVANLTDKAKIEREDTNRTISILSHEATQLKHDYMELLSKTSALNKTINYTTSATVQRALNELNNVKETQRVIQKKLEALSHLNDTAEDYLNLGKEVKNLATQVNQNITHLEENLKDNRREWERALDNKTSEIKSDVLALGNRLYEFENRNRQNGTTNGVGVLGLTKLCNLMFYTIIFWATLDVIVHF
jgi:predicted  nucleic acid-binding Zn-ribbon protein